MPRLSSALVLLACLGLAGCGQSASQKLIGKWKHDLKPAMEGGDAPGGTTSPMWAIAEAAGMKMEMLIEFKDDHTMTTSVPFMSMSAAKEGASVKRTWKVTEVEGNNVTLEISVPDYQRTSTLKITFVDDDHFEFPLPASGGRSLVFARVKGE